MTKIAKELDEKLRTLDPHHAKKLESLVREAIERTDQEAEVPSKSDWPAGYFEQTAGALAGEKFEHPPQGELPHFPSEMEVARAH